VTNTKGVEIYHDEILLFGWHGSTRQAILGEENDWREPSKGRCALESICGRMVLLDYPNDQCLIHQGKYSDLVLN
jgi:hypothetical protein